MIVHIVNASIIFFLIVLLIVLALMFFGYSCSEAGTNKTSKEIYNKELGTRQLQLIREGNYSASVREGSLFLHFKEDTIPMMCISGVELNIKQSIYETNYCFLLIKDINAIIWNYTIDNLECPYKIEAIDFFRQQHEDGEKLRGHQHMLANKEKESKRLIEEEILFVEKLRELRGGITISDEVKKELNPLFIKGERLISIGKEIDTLTREIKTISQ